jgi:hypothetical protein
MLPFVICSTWAAIWSGLNTIEILGKVRLLAGLPKLSCQYLPDTDQPSLSFPVQ